MALPPERNSSSLRTPLHNFTLPDNGLNWVNQRFLRCMKPKPGTDHRFPAARGAGRRRAARFELPTDRQPPSATATQVNSTGRNLPSAEIGAVRERIMLDLREAAERLRISMLEEKPKEKEKELEDFSSSLRPWNLRTRRAACKEPPVYGSAAVGGDGGGGEKGVNFNLSSPVRRQDSRLRGGLDLLVEQSVERPKFSISLTKEEIESDFLAMTGAKPPRKPKKRPKAVQKKLDALVPGLWLSDVTPETYKVSDVPEPRKGQRGK